MHVPPVELDCSRPKAWLRAPIVERDPATGRSLVTGNRRGTPQGGVIRPLLANVDLNRLDWQVNDRCALRPVLVRYADDFVILSRPGQGTELLARLHRWLWRKNGCQQALWATNPQTVLRQRYGLYRLPTRAAWTRAVASKRSE